MERHMSVGALAGSAVSTDFGAGISMVSILQEGDWAKVSTTDRHYFSTYITVTGVHQDSIQ